MGYYVDGTWYDDRSNYVPPYPYGQWTPSVFPTPAIPSTVNTFVFETPWVCPRCGARQLPSEVQTVEIIEPGKNPRVEFHGRIRPHITGYTCLVCGNEWSLGTPPDPEDPTPGGASVSFLHPVNETVPCCEEGSCHICIDRDAC